MKKKTDQLPGQISLDNNPKPVYVCGVRQNVYRRDTLPVHVVPSARQISHYVSLEKKELPNGYVQELVVKDYPINSESVSSLAEGADYKTDPAQAIANATARVNLGDVTQAQAFLENPQNFARVYDDVKEKLIEYYKSQAAAEASSSSDEKTDGGTVDNGN